MKDILNWRKSRRSMADGNCIEVGETRRRPGWRKSRWSGYNANCVEAGSGERTVLVRDTMDRDGTVLAYSAEVWAAFTAKLRSGS
jgi:hypothetical protein